MPALSSPVADRLARPSPPLSPAVARLIEERLRRHLSASAVARVRDAVLQGHVVHLTDCPTRGPVVAYKRGVLFVAGTEYVISED